MKSILIGILVLSVLFVVVMARLSKAQLCPETPAGYQRQLRPEGVPANYPPPEEPACYMQTTQTGASAISCYLCHDYFQRRQA